MPHMQVSPAASPSRRLPGAQLSSKKTRAARQNAGRRVGNHVDECFMRRARGGRQEGRARGEERGWVGRESEGEKNLSGRSDARGRCQEKPALQGAQCITNRQRCWKLVHNAERGKKLALTHISAFVVMAFPAYKLIISGARYERVVYLEDSGHGHVNGNMPEFSNNHCSPWQVN